MVLLLTLRAANKTNQSAIRAANAATETNAIMRDEQRPWLTIKVDPLVAFSTNDVSGYATHRIQYYIENKGKAPAQNYRVNVQFSRYDWQYVGAGRKGVETVISQLRRHKSRSLRVLFPQEKTSGGTWGTANLTGETKGDYFLSIGIVYSLDAGGDKIGYEARSYHLSNENGRAGPFAWKIGEIAEYGQIQ